MASDKPLQRSPLMSLDEALEQVLGQVRVLEETESIAVIDADGRFLAEDLISALQVPPQDNSAMDGYAVRTEDLQSPGAKLQVTQRIPAGHYGHALMPGEAARIFTGAPIPPGANAVVMQEDTQTLESEKHHPANPVVLVNVLGLEIQGSLP